jgi:hypothetical protein
VSVCVIFRVCDRRVAARRQTNEITYSKNIDVVVYMVCNFLRIINYILLNKWYEENQGGFKKPSIQRKRIAAKAL